MDNLALRLSYGLQGNIDKNTSPYLIGDYKTRLYLTMRKQVSAYRELLMTNCVGKKTASYNIGVDFSILKSAINMSVDYYYRKWNRSYWY